MWILEFTYHVVVRIVSLLFELLCFMQATVAALNYFAYMLNKCMILFYKPSTTV